MSILTDDPASGPCRMRAALRSDWLTPLPFFRAAIVFPLSKGRAGAQKLWGLASGAQEWRGLTGWGPPSGGEELRFLRSPAGLAGLLVYLGGARESGARNGHKISVISVIIDYVNKDPEKKRVTKQAGRYHPLRNP